MKSVLMSISPNLCEFIANGKKTVEVRKTKPKLETPFRVYIYCTKGRGDCLWRWGGGIWYDIQFPNERPNRIDGKVIGEFVCDEISELYIACDVHDELPSRPCEYWLEWDEEHDIPNEACLSVKEIMSYLGRSNYGYAWHISDLVIYDKPKELSEFIVEGDCSCENCRKCKWIDRGNGYNVEDDCLLPYTNSFGKALKPLFRPPASWCYVEGY